MKHSFILQYRCHVDKPGGPALYNLLVDDAHTVGEVIADILKCETYGFIKVYSENRDLYVSSMQYKDDRLFDIINPIYDDELVTSGRAVVRSENNTDYELYIK